MTDLTFINMMDDERFSVNMRRWNEVVSINARSKFYDLDGFREGATSLLPIEIAELGDVNGKSLLHLQCHFGMDTLSWARLGANVTGIDFAEKSIDLAMELSDELGIPARFIRSNIYDLSEVLEEEFNIVFTSYGVLCWLPDLKGWAETIHRHLTPGGTFYIVESHPFADILDDKDREGFHIKYPYFTGGESIYCTDEPGTYTDSDIEIVNKDHYYWQHTMQDVLNSLLDAGLEIDYLHEFPFGFFERHPSMKKGTDGLWRFENDAISFPLTFSIKAKRPVQD